MIFRNSPMKTTYIEEIKFCPLPPLLVSNDGIQHGAWSSTLSVQPWQPATWMLRFTCPISAVASYPTLKAVGTGRASRVLERNGLGGKLSRTLFITFGVELTCCVSTGYLASLLHVLYRRVVFTIHAPEVHWADPGIDLPT